MADDSAESRRAFAALLECCRRWLGSASSAALEADSLPWDAIGRMAFVHNLEPLLHHLQNSRLLPFDDLPPSLAEAWERAYFQNYVFNCRALELLQGLARACSDDGVPVVAIKGPAAIGRIYRDPALRIMADLDVLCREADLEIVTQAAAELGFVRGADTSVYHASLQHQSDGLLLELHFDLYDFLPGRQAVHETLLRAAAPLACGDTSVPALPGGLEIAVEVAHLVNHDLQTNLKPYLDLAAGLRQREHRQMLLETVEEWDLEPEFEVIEAILGRLFGEPDCPPDAAPSASQRQIVDASLETIRTIDAYAPAALEELSARPGLSPKLIYLFRLLVRPLQRVPGVPSSVRSRTRGTTGDGGRSPGHIAAVLRRGWRKLRTVGLPRTDSASSIKRQLYARRQRQSRRGRVPT